MSILDNAKIHFKQAISQEMESIDVPEWGTTVYFKRSATLKETEVVVALHKENKIAEALVMTLVLRARDADGNKMFKTADKFDLMNNVDPKVVTRVATAILNSDADADEIAKN